MKFFSLVTVLTATTTCGLNIDTCLECEEGKTLYPGEYPPHNRGKNPICFDCGGRTLEQTERLNELPCLGDDGEEFCNNDDQYRRVVYQANQGRDPQKYSTCKPCGGVFLYGRNNNDDKPCLHENRESFCNEGFELKKAGEHPNPQDYETCKLKACPTGEVVYPPLTPPYNNNELAPLCHDCGGRTKDKLNKEGFPIEALNELPCPGNKCNDDDQFRRVVYQTREGRDPRDYLTCKPCGGVWLYGRNNNDDKPCQDETGNDICNYGFELYATNTGVNPKDYTTCKLPINEDGILHYVAKDNSNKIKIGIYQKNKSGFTDPGKTAMFKVVSGACDGKKYSETTEFLVNGTMPGTARIKPNAAQANIPISNLEEGKHCLKVIATALNPERSFEMEIAFIT
eukprot:Pgem_evm1s2423